MKVELCLIFDHLWNLEFFLLIESPSRQKSICGQLITIYCGSLMGIVKFPIYVEFEITELFEDMCFHLILVIGILWEVELTPGDIAHRLLRKIIRILLHRLLVQNHIHPARRLIKLRIFNIGKLIMLVSICLEQAVLLIIAISIYICCRRIRSMAMDACRRIWLHFLIKSHFVLLK